MRIPDEDLGPGWLRDYESIEVDLRGMSDYAGALRAELEKNYTPHREQVNRDMSVESSAYDERFKELAALLDRHFQSRVLATSLLTEYGNATGTFAAAAQEVGERHGDTDGLAKARAQDVQAILVAPTMAVPDPGARPQVDAGGGA